MKAREHLFALYEQWRRLSLAEGDGILHGAWAEVSRCQNAKHALQERIVAATRALEAEQSALRQDPREIESTIRAVVSQLMELEGQNARQLDQQRAQAEAEEAGTEKSGQNLRHINRAYGQSRQTGWQHYS